MRLPLLGLALLLAAPALRAQEAAPADTVKVEWNHALDHLEGDLDLSAGTTFVAICPPGGRASGSVWGTWTYTSDSMLCPAAVHAGVLSFADGGAAVTEVAPGLTRYVGTSRHGVASLSYPEWRLSFRFPGADTTAAASGAAAPGPGVVQPFQGDWYTQARQLGAGVGTRVRFICSPAGTGGNVWGTDVYTDDSSICEAAVHAGVIERAEGGVVHFELTGAQSGFAASERHGVSSMRYPAWPGSFRFVTIEE